MMAAHPPSIMNLWLSFEGRIGRSDYWLKVALPIFILSILLSFVDAMAGTVIVLGPWPGGVIGKTSLAFFVFSLWPSFATGAKRCHDRDRSGWFQLLLLFPVIGWIWLLVSIGFLKGTNGPNRFGPDPVAM